MRTAASQIDRMDRSLFEDDWDGCGAKAYQPEFLEEAARWTEQVADWLAAQQIDIGEPTVGPVAGDSLDLFWREGAARMLLNYSKDGTVGFHGQAEEGWSRSVFSGHFRATDIAEGPWQWMAKHLKKAVA